MKILVLSDTHGNIEGCLDIKEKIRNIDAIIHLGDNTKDALELENIFDVQMYNVKGNCDFMDYETEDEIIITVQGKKIFLTHGHNYNVKRNLNVIYYRAKELDVDIALFGHSHIPVSTTHDGILLLNPGSVSMPRYGSEKSLAIIEINDIVVPKIISLSELKVANY